MHFVTVDLSRLTNGSAVGADLHQTPWFGNVPILVLESW